MAQSDQAVAFICVHLRLNVFLFGPCPLEILAAGSP